MGVRVGSGGEVDVACPSDEEPAQADVMDMKRTKRSILGKDDLNFIRDPLREIPWLVSSGLDGSRAEMLQEICLIVAEGGKPGNVGGFGACTLAIHAVAWNGTTHS